MTKDRARLVYLLLIWVTVIALFFVFDFTLLNKVFAIWIGICLTTWTLILIHFHYKKWGPEIRDELDKLNLKLISERPLTIFETMQFADTQYFVEIVAFNFKRIIRIQDDNQIKELCIRITKNYLSNSIKKIEIIGSV